MAELDRNTAPEVKAFDRMTFRKERVESLANGARLHIIADPSCPMTHICIAASGGKDEAESQAVAITAVHLLPEGSKEFDYDTTADIIDFYGANLSGSTSDHLTRLDLTALSQYAAELLPVVTATVCAPDFTPERFEAAKSLLSARCAYNDSRVDHIAYKAAYSLIAGEESAKTRFATAQDFVSVGSDAVRSQQRNVFQSCGIDVFLCGGADDRLEQGVRDMAASFPAGRGITPQVHPFTPSPAQTLHIERPGSEQSAVQVMIPAIGREHPDYIPLRLAVTALGGFFGSRLMQNIRENKGLTYGISASLSGMQEGSFIDISAQCAPQHTERLLDELCSELHGMATNPLSPDELLRMRLFEQTRLASLLDNAVATGGHYITALAVGLPDGYFERQERITASITAEDIADVAARYLIADNMRIAIVG